MSRLVLSAGVIAALFAWGASHVAADVQLPEKSAVEVGKPTISGKGPYTVQFRGTVTLERTATKFTGARMSVLDAKQKEAKPILTLVNLPDADPKPGQVRTVVFTATLPKGNYTGVAEIAFIDADGRLQSVTFDVPRFEVP